MEIHNERGLLRTWERSNTAQGQRRAGGEWNEANCSFCCRLKAFSRRLRRCLHRPSQVASSVCALCANRITKPATVWSAY